MDEGLRDVEALLAIAVVVGRYLETGLLAAAEEGVIELVAGLTAADPHRPVAATPRVRPVGEGLKFLKYGRQCAKSQSASPSSAQPSKSIGLPRLKIIALIDVDPPRTR